MDQMKEKVFIGNVADFQLKDAANDQLKSFRRSLNELNKFVELSDLQDILENGSKNISKRFEEHLWQLNADIKYFPDRERHKQSIPILIEYFNKQVENVKRNYDSLPEYLPKEKLLSYEYDDFQRITCKWNHQLLDQAIQEQCELFAQTDREIEVFNCVKDLIDAANKLKTVAGIPFKVTDVIADSVRAVSYNTNTIYEIFKHLKQ
jgi:hypothetical protein